MNSSRNQMNVLIALICVIAGTCLYFYIQEKNKDAIAAGRPSQCWTADCHAAATDVLVHRLGGE